MASVILKCPKEELNVGGVAHIKIEVWETLPQEFSRCGPNMMVELLIDGVIYDDYLVSSYFSPLPWERKAHIWAEIPFSETGTHNLDANLSGGGVTIPPGACSGEDNDSCSFEVVSSGGSDEVWPPGEGPFLILPWYVWGGIGIVGGAMVIKLITKPATTIIVRGGESD